MTVKSDVKATVELMEGQKFRMIRRITILRLKATNSLHLSKRRESGQDGGIRGDSAVAQLDVYAAEDMKNWRWEDCCRRQLLSRRLQFSRGAVYSPKDMAP